MKIKKLLEELIKGGEEELAGKEDSPRFLISLKKKLLGKGFTERQSSFIISSFAKELNSSGWMNKILPEDDKNPDVVLNLNGSEVNFIVVSDSDPRDRKTFTYQGAVWINIPINTGKIK